jgi:hypothetical protein
MFGDAITMDRDLDRDLRQTGTTSRADEVDRSIEKCHPILYSIERGVVRKYIHTRPAHTVCSSRTRSRHDLHRARWMYQDDLSTGER